MLFSDALEVAIGLTFIFLLTSLMMTSLREAIEAVFKTRGEKLRRGFEELLTQQSGALARNTGPAARQNTPEQSAAEGHGESAVRAMYQHPLIQGLFRGNYDTAKAQRRLPSYIPSRNFAVALIDQVLAGRINAATSTAALPGAATPVEQLRFATERIENAQVREAMLVAIDHSAGEMARVQASMEAWYDSAMDRVSGWYKRRSFTILFWSGLAAAILINVNTLAIAQSLSQNAALRRAIAEQAANYRPPQQQGGAQERPSAEPADAALAGVGNEANALVNGAAPEAAPGTGVGRQEPRRTDRPEGAQPLDAVDQIRRIGLPIGWSESARAALLAPLGRNAEVSTDLAFSAVAFVGWLQILVGYLMTALAMALGAPFWFDVLNRLMVIRATVKPHEKSKEEGSQDPQDPNRLAGAGAGAVVLVSPVPANPAAAPAILDPHVYAEAPAPGERPLEEEEEFEGEAPPAPPAAEQGVQP